MNPPLARPPLESHAFLAHPRTITRQARVASSVLLLCPVFDLEIMHLSFTARALSRADGTQLGWTTQAIGQQHTSPLHAGCEARRREIAVIFCCGNGLARDAPEASKVDWTT